MSCKKYISKELKPAAGHATRWWDWCLAEDEKKRVEAIFIGKNEYKVDR